MRAFVINLDRSPDRLASFADQANRFGIDFERIEAFDGKKLTAEQLMEFRSRQAQFQPIDDGNIGLMLSHQKAWKSLLAGGDQCAAIFEDDVVMSSTIARALESIDRTNGDFDIIKLETTLRKVVCSGETSTLSPQHRMQPLLTWHGGTAGYVISRKCAARLLIDRDKITDIIDLTLFHPRSRITRKFNIQQLIPAVCVQSQFLAEQRGPEFESTLGKPSVDSHLLRYGIWVDAKRFVRRQHESIRRRWLARQTSNEELVVPLSGSDALGRAA